jgi:hypothetical protein
MVGRWGVRCVGKHLRNSQKEDLFLEALAKGKPTFEEGPKVIAQHNAWLFNYLDKMLGMYCSHMMSSSLSRNMIVMLTI